MMPEENAQLEKRPVGMALTGNMRRNRFRRSR